METMVMKFGGSSVANDEMLNAVAKKIIEYKKSAKNIVVIVSAQGKTTNNLIEQGKNLSSTPNQREMDVLVSVGEQISASKLAILLNKLGFASISLTGWQAGIRTNSIHEQAKIESINTARIKQELENKKIVVITGFQGIDEYGDITTLGRGGSDTTAVSIAAALNAGECYIFSDVDGIYSADPHVVKNAKKIDEISYKEMEEISGAGAKVLHDRCVHVGEKFDCKIIALSTFENVEGTKVGTKIETTEIKSIVNNTKINLYRIENDGEISSREATEVYECLLKQNIVVDNFKYRQNIEFYALQGDENKIIKSFESKYKVSSEKIEKISIIGYGITQDNSIIMKILEIVKNRAEIIDLNLSQCKVELLLKNVDSSIVQELHNNLIDK